MNTRNEKMKEIYEFFDLNLLEFKEEIKEWSSLKKKYLRDSVKIFNLLEISHQFSNNIPYDFQMAAFIEEKNMRLISFYYIFSKFYNLRITEDGNFYNCIAEYLALEALD